MKTIGTALGLVSIALCLAGCAVGWQINMPMAYSQAHSRGSSYNAADAKQMDISGTSEAFQQQRASTTTGDALSTSVEADKATDLAAAKDQSQVTTETAKTQHEGQATASGEQNATSSPTDTTSVAPQVNVAPGGIAAGAQTAPAASPGTNTTSPTGSQTQSAAPSIAELQAAVESAQKVCDLCGEGGAADGTDTPAQTQAKANLAAAKAALAAAQAK